MDALPTFSFVETLHHNEEDVMGKSSLNETKIIKIQKCFRGYSLRLKQLPLIMYKIKKYLELNAFQFSTQNEDGRVNSCIDESHVIKLLIEKFGEKIKKTKIRNWCDILARDDMYGWIPI